MPCGGHDLDRRPPDPGLMAAVRRCHDGSLSDAERMDALRMAFFAPGNDPSVWLDGWWPQAAGTSQAIFRSDPEAWWRAGDGPILIIMPLNDALYPAEAGRDVATALGDRATYVEIDNCGHALLPEQPQAIAQNLIDFLDRH